MYLSSSVILASIASYSILCWIIQCTQNVPLDTFYFIFQVCLWGEFVNSINAIPRLWPRASAGAEVLWSQKTDELNSAASRLQEHECRMMARGKSVQPIVGAGFCPGHWDF